MRDYNVERLAEKIVARIILDFTDRRGLRQSWEQIDDDIRDDIERTWRSIVKRCVSEFDQG